MLKVWGRRSSANVQKVLWLVGELDLPYTHSPAGGDFGGLDDPAFRALNPHGKVPVIEDGGVVVWEIHAILRYLAAAYGADRFWSPDPAVRAPDRRLDGLGSDGAAAGLPEAACSGVGTARPRPSVTPRRWPRPWTGPPPAWRRGGPSAGGSRVRRRRDPVACRHRRRDASLSLVRAGDRASGLAEAGGLVRAARRCGRPIAST